MAAPLLSGMMQAMRKAAAVTLAVLAGIAILISPGHMTRYFPWQFYIPVALLPLGLLLAAWWLIQSDGRANSGQDEQQLDQEVESARDSES